MRPNATHGMACSSSHAGPGIAAVGVGDHEGVDQVGADHGLVAADHRAGLVRRERHQVAAVGGRGRRERHHERTGDVVAGEPECVQLDADGPGPLLFELPGRRRRSVAEAVDDGADLGQRGGMHPVGVVQCVGDGLARDACSLRDLGDGDPRAPSRDRCRHGRRPEYDLNVHIPRRRLSQPPAAVNA